MDCFKLDGVNSALRQTLEVSLNSYSELDWFYLGSILQLRLYLECAQAKIKLQIISEFIFKIRFPQQLIILVHKLLRREIRERFDILERFETL